MDQWLMFCMDGEGRAEEYLTIEEVAARLKVKPKTIRNKMFKGLLRKDEHYFSPEGLGPRFKWSKVVEWLEREKKEESKEKKLQMEIPMSKGYKLGGGNDIPVASSSN